MVAAAGITTMVLYNQILGVNPKLLGLAFLIAAIVDAISDPLVGRPFRSLQYPLGAALSLHAGFSVFSSRFFLFPLSAHGLSQ